MVYQTQRNKLGDNTSFHAPLLVPFPFCISFIIPSPLFLYPPRAPYPGGRSVLRKTKHTKRASVKKEHLFMFQDPLLPHLPFLFYMLSPFLLNPSLGVWILEDAFPFLPQGKHYETSQAADPG